MEHQTYNNRRIIWKSKIKQVGLISISFLFVCMAVWTRNRYSTFSFWGTIIFFGVGGISLLYRLVTPKNLFVTHTSALGRQIIAHQFREAQADLGAFSYDESGFLLTENIGTAYYEWADLETVFGYKQDDYVTDEICLDLFFNNGACLNLTEVTRGWYQFLIELHKKIDSISSNWQITLATPAFETRYILLFDKNSRTKEQVEAIYYKK